MQVATRGSSDQSPGSRQPLPRLQRQSQDEEFTTPIPELRLRSRLVSWLERQVQGAGFSDAIDIVPRRKSHNSCALIASIAYPTAQQPIRFQTCACALPDRAVGERMVAFSSSLEVKK